MKRTNILVVKELTKLKASLQLDFDLIQHKLDRLRLLIDCIGSTSHPVPRRRR